MKTTLTERTHTMNGTALADQADAANTETLDVYARMAEYINGTVVHGPLTPRQRGFVEALGLRLVEGRTQNCRHYAWTAPQPMFWTPDAPGLIRCRECLKAVNLRIKGTDQDYTCNVCHRFSRPLYGTSFRVPSAVLDAPEVPFAVASPAISIMYGACLGCSSKRTPNHSDLY